MRLEPEREKRFVDLALVSALIRQEQVLGELLGDGRAALYNAAGLRIGDEGAEQALRINAEMLVKAVVLGCQHRLDQVIGHLVEWDRLVVLDAAAADLVAEAVEKGNREIGFFKPVIFGGLAEGGDRQR